MKTRLIVNFQVEGLHQWRDAKKVVPPMGFLSDKHRHLFYITVVIDVNDLDREIEFIAFKQKLTKFVEYHWYDEYTGMCDFGGMSCEMIAKEILQAFAAHKVRVMEDNENGAEVEA
jgi:hypothetical protein